MGLSRAHARSRIHPVDRRGPLQRRLHDQLEIQRVSRASSAAPATGPASPPAAAAASRKTPVAICRLKRVAADFKDDVKRPHAAAAATEERQAHRDRRRRSRLADGGARSRAARLSLHRVRWRPQGGRHDADADSEIPPAGFGDRRGNRLHPRSRHRVQGRPPHRQPEEAARRRLRRDLRRLRRAARPRARASPAARKPPPTSISASTGSPASRSATPTRSASA